MPTNPASGQSWCIIGNGTCFSELSNSNYFGTLPTSPNSDPYYYYDYGSFGLVAVHMENEQYGSGSRGWHCSDAAGGVAGSKYYCLEFDK